jgi:hypothetical protein
MNRYWLTRELVERLREEERRRAQVAAERKAVKRAGTSSPMPSTPASRRREPNELPWAGPELHAIADSFDALELPSRSSSGLRPPCGPRELQTLRNRLADGCTLDELRAAVEGAARTVWARRGDQGWAIAPFAVVFNDAASVRRFVAFAPLKPSSTTAAAPSSPFDLAAKGFG